MDRITLSKKDIGRITINGRPLAKTDKVSMPNDDIWDKLEFEWVEE